MARPDRPKKTPPEEARPKSERRTLTPAAIQRLIEERHDRAARTVRPKAPRRSSR